MAERYGSDTLQGCCCILKASFCWYTFFSSLFNPVKGVCSFKGNLTNMYSNGQLGLLLGPTRHAGKVIVLVKYNTINCPD